MPERSSVVLVPTYNEAENIGLLLERLLKEVPSADILVIDDNSPDGTRGVVAKFLGARVHLLERAGKEGLGRAYIAGFDWACRHGYERCIQMDADFSHDPRYVAPLLGLLDRADLAIGSRYMSGGGTHGWSAVREFISRGGNTYARFILGLKLNDLTGGFNAWRTAMLERIDFRSIQAVGYAFQVELKYRAHKAEARIAEMPIVFPDRVRGVSKMSGNIVFEAARRVVELRLGK